MPALIPCLVTLRAEYNTAAPGRDKGADGWIGDSAHQERQSDHNPDSRSLVHALDIDSTGPWPDPDWFDASVKLIVDRQRKGLDDRLEYVIWNRQIASRDRGWTWRTYTGTSDPHINHAHFSGRHSVPREKNTGPWHLEEVPVALTADDKKWIQSAIAAEVAKVAGQVWGYRLDDPKITDDPKNPGADDKTAATWLQWTPSFARVDGVGDKVDQAKDEILAALKPTP